jgi:phosphatidylglycerol---prolipoprotein diacylglyceryl transferase
MFPVLLELGPFKIHTYGFLIAVGFLVAIRVVKVMAVRQKVPFEPLMDMAFWGLILGFTGGRVLFIITRWEYFSANPLEMFAIWKGGLVFYGAAITVIPFAAWYMKHRQMPVWKSLDILNVGLVIGHMFGRFGCLSAGCCYGKPTGQGWGVRFHTDMVDASLRGIPLHPTQLYEAGSLFLLALGMMWIHKIKKFDGQVLLTYLMVYPIIRSVIEVYRGDKIRGFLIQDVLSTSQFISIIVFIVATVLLLKRLQTVKQGR